MSLSIDLTGRIALVTGAGRGIGRGIALLLAEQGADVAVNYRRDEAAAEAVVAAIRVMGRRAEKYAASVDDLAQCEALVEAVAHDFGGIDILVNNAGIASAGRSVEATDPAEFERVMRVHAFEPYFLSRLVMPHMHRKDRGDILMISSLEYSLSRENGAPYNMV